MRQLILVFVAGLLVLFTSSRSMAQADTAVKTATITLKATSPRAAVSDLQTLLMQTADYSVAADAIKSTGLDATLRSAGPYTLFLPTNSAFAKLSPSSRDSLMKNPARLNSFMKQYIVTGRYTRTDLVRLLAANGGKATIATIDGRTLTLSISPYRTLQITSPTGSTAEVSAYDAVGNNGVLDGINAVLK